MAKRISLAVVAFLPAAMGLSGVPMRPVSFAERVDGREAIERVYDAHRIWPKENPGPKPPFEARMPREVIEELVRDDLRKGAALERYWERPVTTEQLQAEMDRMARATRDPALLRELIRALGDDPVLVAECLARPALTERQLESWYACDRRFHEEPWGRAERAQRTLTAETFESSPDGELSRQGGSRDGEAPGADLGPADGVVRLREREGRIQLVLVRRVATGVEALVRSFPKTSFSAWWEREQGADPEPSLPPAAGVVSLPGAEDSALASVPCDSWIQASNLVGPPSARSGHSAIWTGAEMIVWSGSTIGDSNTGGRYAPATDTWRPLPTAVVSGRWGHTAVWTGSEMIVWGGRVSGYLADGARYDPVRDTWVATSTVGAPAPRSLHTAVWTGSEMIVWGGNVAGGVTNTGGRYDPVTDSWRATSTAGACPGGRVRNTAVWTGSVMVVWGGYGGAMNLGDGGRYDPATDTWSGVSFTGAPTPRRRHAAVWSGTEMIVWGGVDPAFANTGGRYDPVANSWRATSTAGACPSSRQDHTAVWAGSEMIVWGGTGSGGEVSTGGRYDPVADGWTATSTNGACPSARRFHASIWTGSEMILWGGDGGPALDTGGRYAPSTDSWVAITPSGPAARYRHTAVWTGAEMVIWGGSDPNEMNTGGRYRPATDTWVATSTAAGCPAARGAHTAVWTGSEMLIWGGIRPGVGLNTGGRYTPATDAWVTTSTGAGCPIGRGFHSSVWTGTEMIVWGGYDGGVLRTGGRYAPATDTWTPTSTGTGCPVGRTGHGAVWTGSEMVVWGGATTSGPLASGARYSPAADAWSATTSAAAPSARFDHTVVWTGDEMIVWGGEASPGYLNTGGRYDPIQDAWTPTATTGACPSPRSAHSAVWSGQTMIVWGGYDPPDPVSSGGVYAPLLDSWTATSTAIGCPEPRLYHSAVWIGSGMIVWGGQIRSGFGSTGGLYGPCVADYLAGAGLGAPNPPSVKLYTASGAPTSVDFPAYGVSAWGVNVASGAIDGTGPDAILTGPGPGDVFGPHVRGWDRTGSSIGKVSFYAHGTLKYGVNVTAGDLEGDGYEEMLTGAGPGTVFGPHVRGFDYDGAALAAIQKINFFAYGTLQYGVNVADGSVDADAFAEIATGPGPGPGFSPQVRGFDYDGVALGAIAKINYNALPYPGYGVRSALGDVDGDGYAEIASTPGPGPGHPWRYLGHGYDGTAVAPLPGYDVTPFAGSGYGGRAGVGDVERDGREDLLCGAGPDPVADTKVIGYRYTVAQQLQRLPVTIVPFLALRYGVNAAAGEYGY